MLNNIVVCEIEKSTIMNPYIIGTNHTTAVWKYVLWNTYSQTLPFMSATDTNYPSATYIFGGLIIDSAPYYRCITYAECETTAGSYYVSGANLYIHFPYHYNPLVHMKFVNGVLYGFTNTKPMRYNQVTYLPEIDTVPTLSEKVDPLKYSKMGMQSGSAVLTNFIRYFDDKALFFGNDFNVKAGEDTGNYDDLIPIQKFYIENYAPTMSKCTFTLKDKRELLSVKCPTALFNATTYPNIETSLIGKVIPDAYGSLLGVPGICVNGGAGNVARVFKFASAITSNDKVYCYKFDKWQDITANITSIDNANGTITIPVTYACSGGTTLNGGVYTNGVAKIKADGVFRPETNPGDIIKSINAECGNIPDTATNYMLDEWSSELDQLPDVGLYMGESKEIYNWIEKLQNGSVVGFQYLHEYGFITARLDNPNRDVIMSIPAEQIINLNDIEIEYNGNNFSSSAKIGYASDMEGKASKYFVNDDYKTSVLDIFRKESIYEIDTLLATEALADDKSEIIMDDQKTIRPIYKNVKVVGTQFYSLRLYDIVEAEITVKGIPTIDNTPYTVRVVYSGVLDGTSTDDYEEIELLDSTDYNEVILLGARTSGIVRNTDRPFAGTVRAQIIGKSIDVEKGIVSLTLRARPYSTVYANIMGA